MNCEKMGQWLRALRTEARMTQRELAQRLCLTDKTVSKWETGKGCPDVSLLTELSEIFHVDLKDLLRGDRRANEAVGGNLQRVRFYVCPECGNVLTGTGQATVSCCGRILQTCKPHAAEEPHRFTLERVEDELYVHADHAMTKEHFLSFVAVCTGEQMLFVKLYPEQDVAVRIPLLRRAVLYSYCTRHGLFEQTLSL